MFRIKVIPHTWPRVKADGIVVKDVDEEEEVEETEESLAAGRFVEMFLRHLLKGIDAKEKFVRLRVCQLIALAMNSMGEIEYPLASPLLDMSN
jgi:condensin complex subunit 3